MFLHHFGDLQESEQVHQLQERIRPYVLRRMKEAVEKSIPPKEETIVEVRSNNRTREERRERNNDIVTMIITQKRVIELIHLNAI